MAQTFGKYEVVAELYSTPDGSVYSARPVAASDGGARAARELREVRYAVKVYNPTGLDLDELFWESQSFLERARVQQRTADVGNGNWAPIYEMGTSPAGAYYVTDFHPLSAASLITGRVDVGPGVLYAIVKSVVAALVELKETAGRSHGNLKPGNVLISSRGDVAVAGAVLADPAPAADAAKLGEAGDLQSLGELISLLVTGRPFPGGAAWPVPPSREWNRLGSQPAKQWRRLCNDLLDPDSDSRTGSLAALARQLPRLAPRRPRRTRRAVIAVVSALLFIAVGASAMLVVQDIAARKEIYSAKARWAGPLAETLATSSPRRRVIESDPDLRVVVQELASAHLEQFDRPDEKGRFSLATVLPALWNLKEFRQTQETLSAVRRAERGLSPLRWRQLARATDLQGQFADRGWAQPAGHLAERVAAARPGSSDLAGGIERLLGTLASVDRDLRAAQEEWKALQNRTAELDQTRDPVLKGFAKLLMKSAAGSVRLNDGGFSDLGGLHRAAARAAELAEARAKLAPGDYDEERFVEAVRSQFDPANLREADIGRWLETFKAHAVLHADISAAAESLRKLADATSRDVLDSRPDAAQRAEFDRERVAVNARIAYFQGRPFIRRDLDDGTFDNELKRVRSEVLTLATFARQEDPQDWLKTLVPLASSSRTLNDTWERWRGMVAEKAPPLASDLAQYAALKTQTQDVRKALAQIADVFPPVPKGLPDAFAAAANLKREQSLGKLLGAAPPVELASNPDAMKAAAAAYGQWAADLAELAKDFPLEKEILGPDDRPDARWADPRKAEFWNDPVVRRLVERDVKRLADLRDLAARPRAELADVARTGPSAEIALQAWRLLGSDRVRPGWPTQEGDLQREADIRDHLNDLLARSVRRLADKQLADGELAREAPVRWRRYAEAARDVKMLAAAARLREKFAVDQREFDRLAPAPRFNLSLYAVRQRIEQSKAAANGNAGANADAAEPQKDDPALDAAVKAMKAAAAELRGEKSVADLDARLAGVNAKEPFAERRPGNVFVHQPPGMGVPLEFRRVDPKDPADRPFYLGTTEVSVAQLAAVVEWQLAWGRMQSLVWAPSALAPADPRRGPRTWEWARPAMVMSPPILWLTPDEANSYPQQFRDPRSPFNSAVLGPAFGGMPLDTHPVQYVSGEAALLVAGLAGCRLPTAHEWQVAYEQSGKAVPAEKWNLRDKTWGVQRDYAASADADQPVPMPDAGIYLPATPPGGKPIPAGAAARVHPTDDRTLYFRTVDSPEAGLPTFRHLVGNVAELVCDAPQAFESYSAKEKATVEGVKRFAKANAEGFAVIGGSALSPPELPLNEPLTIKPGESFADVGFRLAFTAPSRGLAERLERALVGQEYVWAPNPAPRASAGE